MPLGFERLNERTMRPNPLINFIKPLPGPSAATATRILNRVAARCYPIMKASGTAVMALEEHAPNAEFVGRNFNAGEVVQLVLRSRAGRWLSVRQVEMVMMHELAHCKEMNHSGAFWRVRDAYAGELRGLWAKGYTGEGLWGRGRGLEDGEVVNEDEVVEVGDVENLCGGTYRSRARKRKGGGKEKAQLSYAERQQRRILRKFGAGGTALGADEEVKLELEDGKKTKGKGKPRVAGSARGRELRAAAALARFDVKKEDQEDDIKKEGQDSETDSDDEYDGADGPTAVDVDGSELRDGKGNDLIKICGDEDHDDVHVKQEMDEIRELRQEKTTKFTKKRPQTTPAPIDVSDEDIAPPKKMAKSARAANSSKQTGTASKPAPSTNTRKAAPEPSTSKASTNRTKPSTASQLSANLACPVCSLVNGLGAVSCAACANVLKPKAVAGSWKCQSLTCRGGAYVNAGDSGRCGVCGAAKSVQ